MGKVITLGEIMLRLSTQQGTRIGQSESFQIHYGGAEANVAVSLANYGHTVYFASKVPENSLGEAARKHLQRYDVNTEYLVTGGSRLGVYYLEAGVGERAAAVVYDRAGSSFAEIKTLEWDLDELFQGKDLFHISGITPALSAEWLQWTLDLMDAAKRAKCKISFDINYRNKLWTQQKAGAALQKILPKVDYCSAGQLDACHLLKVAEPDKKAELTDFYQAMHNQFPNIQVFYSTKRTIRSASDNQLVGTLWIDGQYYESKSHEINPIVDRVGGGDAFSGGILHGLLAGLTPQETVNFAAAAAALKHTVHGDCNQFDQQEVMAFMTSFGKIIR